MPEFRDAVPEDYEFRADDKLVRKDRWESAVNSIRYLVGINSREFEISEVVDAVREMVADRDNWVDFILQNLDDHPNNGEKCDIKFKDDGVLLNTYYQELSRTWVWRKMEFQENVVAWHYAKV